MKKRVISLMFMLVFALTFTFTTAYAADSTIVLAKRDLAGGVKQPGIANTYFKTVGTSSGVIPGYCLNMGKASPANGSTLMFVQDITTPQLVYIMEHGYHNGGYDSSVMGSLNDDQAYYATQLAVWLYQGSISVGQLAQNNPACVAAINLYNKALGYSMVPLENYYSDLAAATYEMSLNSDKTLYTSSALWINGTGGAGSFSDVVVTVTASNGSTDFRLVKEDGTEFRSGDRIARDVKWYVVIPADKVTGNMTFSVKWNPTWNVTRVYSYASAEANKQTIGVFLPATHSLNREEILNLKYKVQPTCESDLATILGATPVDKRTYDNTEYMNALAALKAKYPEADIQDITKPSCTPVNHSCETDLAAILGATPVDKRTSDNKAYIDALTELKAKYKDADISDITNPSCTPRKVYTKQLIVHKQDASSKAELAGATLAIKDANGNIVKQWVSTAEPYVINDLPAGSYTLVELASPAGYELGDGVIEFKLEGEDYNQEITMYNSPIPVTADMNFALIVTAFIVFLGFGIFGLVQASKREA